MHRLVCTDKNSAVGHMSRRTRSKSCWWMSLSPFLSPGKWLLVWLDKAAVELAIGRGVLNKVFEAF